MPATKPAYEVPDQKVEVYEAPKPAVNFERLHGAALEEIKRLNDLLAVYQGYAKIVNIVSGPLGVIALDDRGRIFERMNSNEPRGPGPVPKIWVQIQGPESR